MYVYTYTRHPGPPMFNSEALRLYKMSSYQHEVHQLNPSLQQQLGLLKKMPLQLPQAYLLSCTFLIRL